MYGNEIRAMPTVEKKICLQGTKQSEESARAFYPNSPL